MAFTGDRMKEVLHETIQQGYTVFKFKVGTSVEKDRERLSAVRAVLGYDKGYQIMIDANQVRLPPSCWVVVHSEGVPLTRAAGMERPGGD